MENQDNDRTLTPSPVARVKDNMAEIDRNARAYGFEIGRGHPLVDVIKEVSPDNPFMGSNWREHIVLESMLQESSLVAHARTELQLLGEDEQTIRGYLRVIQAFADMGHSGGSASVAIPVISALLQFQNLKPLTNDPAEWTHVGEERWGSPGGVWQSRRRSEAFSNDGGKTYYLLSEGDKDMSRGPMHTSIDPT